jgi:hypothetical protein
MLVTPPIGFPDSYNSSTGNSSGQSSSESEGWGSAQTHGTSWASTTSESTSKSQGKFTSETEGEGETHTVGRSDSVEVSEGVARSTGRAVGTTTTSGSNSGLAISQGYSEGLIPIMALRPGSVHSKENVLYQAAQMLCSLPTGQCVINYVGRNGMEAAALRIPYRPTIPLSEEAFAKARLSIFEASPSAQPIADAEARLKERRRLLASSTKFIEPEPTNFRVPARRRRNAEEE